MILQGEFRLTVRFIWVTCWIILCLSHGAAAIGLYGTSRTTTSLLFGNPTTAERFQFTETLTFNTRSLGFKNITFHSQLSTQSKTDDSWDQDSRFRLNYGYLKWQHPTENLKVKLGRTFSNNGPYFSAVDGVAIELSRSNIASLKAQFGTEAPLATADFQNWGNSTILGAQLSLDSIEYTKASISYERLERDNLLQQHAISLEASRFIRYWEMHIHGSVDFDLVRDRLDRFSLEAKYLFYTGTQLYGEFVHRKPRVNPHSVLAVFSQSPVNEIHIGFKTVDFGKLRMIGRYTSAFFSGAQGHQLKLGLTSPWLTATVGGDLLDRERRYNFSIQTAISPFRFMNITPQATWFSFTNKDDARRDRDLFLIQSRFRLFLNRSVSAVIDLENGSQQEPDSNMNLRIRSALVYRFSR